MRYTKAFTYLFKEKNWSLKLLAPMLIHLVVGVIAMIIAFMLRSTSLYSYDFVFLLVIGICVIYVFAIVASVISLFYSYENAQAAIENRESKGFWQYKFEVLLKRIGKLYLVDLIYGLIPGILFSCIGTAVSLLFQSARLSNVNTYMNGYSIPMPSVASNGIDISRNFSPAAVLIFFCLTIFVVLLATIWQYFVVLPGKLSLIQTNTFGEAFKISRNFKLVKVNLTAFIKFYFLNLGIALFLLAAIFVVAFVLSFLLVTAPLLGWILIFILMLIVTILAAFYQSFVLPYMTGILWRGVIDNK